MDFNWLPEWLLNPALTTILLAGLAFVFKGPLSTILVRSVERRFDERLEATRATARSNESELASIRSFLVNRQSDRSIALQTKRLEAAESLLRNANVLAGLSMFVEFMKLLKLKKVSEAKDQAEVKEFFATLEKGFKLDETLEQLKTQDKALARLYLSTKALEYYDAYSLVQTYAAMYIKSMSLGLDAIDVLKSDALSNKLIEVIPNSKEGFAKYGENYAYYWAEYLYDQLIRQLRADVSGVSLEQEDVSTISRVTASSLKAQAEARALAMGAHLPPEFVKQSDELTEQ